MYSLGCTWCNEEAYIEQQTHLDALCDNASKEMISEILSDAHAIHRAAEVGMPRDCRVPDVIAAMRAEIERLRAHIAELERLLHDLLLLDESIGNRLRRPHGWSDEDKRQHALELTAREQKQTDARKALEL